MRRADRLFDIIQTLRVAPRPLTAAALAEKLEVTVRTIYRDVAALQASRVPIEGAPGIGYVLRRGLRDPKIQQAAERVLAKVTAVLPETVRGYLAEPPFYVSEGSAPPITGVD